MRANGEVGGMAADVLLDNGLIYTGYAGLPVASALAITGGRVTAYGDIARTQATARTHRIDLAHGFAFPGFVDAHIHLHWYGLLLDQVELTDVASYAEVERRIGARIQTTSAGDWVVGGGWNQDLWDGGQPTRHALDRLTARHPVVLRRKDGHSIWVNSVALQRAGISSTTSDPPGGRIEHDSNGEPSGILAEEAMDLVESLIALPSEQSHDQALTRATTIAHQAGLTGIHAMERSDARAAYQRAHERGTLSLRTIIMADLDAWRLGWPASATTNSGPAMLRTGGLKLFADGALGSRTAAMLEPFAGQPTNTGVVVTPADDMEQLIHDAALAGLSAVIHAIGDRANRIVLNAFERTRNVWQPRHLRQRIEHVQLLHPDDLPRLAALGIVASMQPTHATADMHMADTYWGERNKLGYAWRSVLDSGAALAFGSDCPVETLSVLEGIHAAVTRTDSESLPRGGWYPEQRVSVAEAIAGYTAGPAYAAHREHELGSLAPGKFADVTVLSGDPYHVDPAEIRHLNVTMTIVNGIVRYAR